MLFGSYRSDLDLSGTILKASENQREPSKELVSAALLSSSTRCQEFKDNLERAILTCSDIDVSFDSFPYFLR